MGFAYETQNRQKCECISAVNNREPAILHAVLMELVMTVIMNHKTRLPVHGTRSRPSLISISAHTADSITAQ